MKLPTSADVTARRMSVLKETLRHELKEGDLDLYVEVVTQLAEEGPFDMADIAAADCATEARDANCCTSRCRASQPLLGCPTTHSTRPGSDPPTPTHPTRGV